MPIIQVMFILFQNFYDFLKAHKKLYKTVFSLKCQKQPNFDKITHL